MIVLLAIVILAGLIGTVLLIWLDKSSRVDPERLVSNSRTELKEALAPGEWHRIRRTFHTIPRRSRIMGVVESIATVIFASLLPAVWLDPTATFVVFAILMASTYGCLFHGALWPEVLGDAYASNGEIRLGDIRGSKSFPRTRTHLSLCWGRPAGEGSLTVTRDDGLDEIIHISFHGVAVLESLGWSVEREFRTSM